MVELPNSQISRIYTQTFSMLMLLTSPPTGRANRADPPVPFRRSVGSRLSAKCRSRWRAYARPSGLKVVDDATTRLVAEKIIELSQHGVRGDCHIAHDDGQRVQDRIARRHTWNSNAVPVPRNATPIDALSAYGTDRQRRWVVMPHRRRNAPHEYQRRRIAEARDAMRATIGDWS